MPVHGGRFADRVDAYTRGRPAYPATAIDFILRVTGARPDGVAADIGSGTGILTEALLPRLGRVFAVEPDANMRAAAERGLAGRPGFRSIAGTAEATTLPARSVDLITVAQAFHWCDPDRAAPEFRRILKPDAAVVLLWNSRRESGDPFHDAYEALLRRWGTDYQAVRSSWESEAALRILWPGGWGHARFRNSQRLDLDGLTARLVSSSYTPGEGHPDRQPMLEALGVLFRDHAQAGTITMLYDTDVFFGVP